jgi:hypothetical protein
VSSFDAVMHLAKGGSGHEGALPGVRRYATVSDSALDRRS